MALPWIVVIEDLPTLILHSSLNPSLPSLSPRPSGQCANLICPNQQASLSPKDHCVPRPYPQLEQSPFFALSDTILFRCYFRKGKYVQKKCMRTRAGG